jgi:hypothetical protein
MSSGNQGQLNDPLGFSEVRRAVKEDYWHVRGIHRQQLCGLGGGGFGRQFFLSHDGCTRGWDYSRECPVVVEGSREPKHHLLITLGFGSGRFFLRHLRKRSASSLKLRFVNPPIGKALAFGPAHDVRDAHENHLGKAPPRPDVRTLPSRAAHAALCQPDATGTPPQRNAPFAPPISISPSEAAAA